MAPDEVDRVAGLSLAAYRALPGQALSDDYAHALSDVATRAAAALVLVAVSGGEVRGAVTYVDDVSSPYAERLVDGEVGLRMLAVDPPAQGQGIGAVLLGECIERARRAGAVRLVLHSTPWMTVAHRLYARLGFRRAPARDLDVGPALHLLAFTLDLAPGGDPGTGATVAPPGPGGGTGQTRGA